MGDAGMNGANGAEGARGVAVMLPPVENLVSGVPLVNTAYTPEQYAAYLNQAVAAAQVTRSSNLSQTSSNLICLAYFSNLAPEARVWKMVAAEVNASWVVATEDTRSFVAKLMRVRAHERKFEGQVCQQTRMPANSHTSKLASELMRVASRKQALQCLVDDREHIECLVDDREHRA